MNLAGSSQFLWLTPRGSVLVSCCLALYVCVRLYYQYFQLHKDEGIGVFRLNHSGCVDVSFVKMNKCMCALMAMYIGVTTGETV